jgi:hypothetical protein
MRIPIGVIASMMIVSAKVGASCMTTSAYFANGMFNDTYSAQRSLRTLSESFRKTHPNSARKYRSWKVAYNTNESVIIQLWQVFDQKRSEVKGNFWQSIFTLLSRSPDARKRVRSILAKFSHDQSLQDADLRHQVSDYRRDLDLGLRIATIAHSQGNLYSLFAFDQLANWSDRLTLFAVATPAGRTFNDGDYTTFLSDAVIKYIPGALSPNTRKARPGIFDHRFVEDYLGSPETRAEIFQVLDDAAGLVENGDSLLAEGTFNEDLDPIVAHFRNYFKDPGPMEAPQCLVYWLLNDLRVNLNENDAEVRNCTARNKNALTKRVEACVWDLDLKHRTWGECVFSGLFGGQPDHPWSRQMTEDLVRINPHCDWHNISDLHAHLKIAGAQEALRWINQMTGPSPSLAASKMPGAGLPAPAKRERRRVQ